MQKLLDVLNKLAEKYNMDEQDVNEIREAVFAVENGEDSLLNAEEDFKDPDEETEEEVHLDD